jgi:hypothetical protein
MTMLCADNELSPSKPVVVRLFPEDICEFSMGSLRCVLRATSIVEDIEYNRILRVCDEHKTVVVQRVGGTSGYIHQCKNCGCYQPMD